MNRISGLIVKLISGVIVLYLLIHTLSPGGPLGNLTGMLITKYPFHQGLLDVFASSLGWDISFVPVVQSSLLDDILILLIAAVISGGISTTMKHIFNPIDLRDPDTKEYMRTTGYRLKGVAASVLASVVSILFSNMIFTSILQKVNGMLLGSFLFTIIKIVLLVAVIFMFVLFVKGAASGISGKGFGIGILLFWAIKSLLQTVLIVVMSVYILVGIVNSISGIAGVILIVFVVIALVSFVGRSIRG